MAVSPSMTSSSHRSRSRPVLFVGMRTRAGDDALRVQFVIVRLSMAADGEPVVAGIQVLRSMPLSDFESRLFSLAMILGLEVGVLRAADQGHDRGEGRARVLLVQRLVLPLLHGLMFQGDACSEADETVIAAEGGPGCFDGLRVLLPVEGFEFVALCACLWLGC